MTAVQQSSDFVEESPSGFMRCRISWPACAALRHAGQILEQASEGVCRSKFETVPCRGDAGCTAAKRSDTGPEFE
jgi:hypothetical protein